MEITAETFGRQAGVLRSGRPGGAFTIAGSFAERIFKNAVGGAAT